MRWLVVSLVLTALGCAVTNGPTGAVRDAGRDTSVRSDTGLTTEDAGSDAGADAGDDAGDDGGRDAGDDVGVDGGSDAGHDAGHDAAVLTPPVVDGVVGGTEWAAATSASSSTLTSWTGDELLTLRAVAIGGVLYVAVEGRVESGNAMLVYVDGDPGGAHGVADLTTLTDSSAGLDDAISAGFTQPSVFRADVAWGTTAMSHVASSADVTTGFRDLVSSPADFAWLAGPTSCTAGACEASIATASLGPGPAPRTIALFARIASPNGLVSPNQTLPTDNPSAPRVVSVVMTVHE